MVLVDSSAWIEALRRNGDLRVKLAIEGLLDAYEAQWCTPIRLEVLGGARKEERTRLGHWFSVIPYRSVREEDWERAIALAWRLRDGGLTVPWRDVADRGRGAARPGQGLCGRRPLQGDLDAAPA
jgi:predicted nucleic acid-binding protein